MTLTASHKVHPDLPNRTTGKDPMSATSSPLTNQVTGPRVLRAIKNLIGIVSSMRRCTRQRLTTVHVDCSHGTPVRPLDLSFIDFNPEACCIVDMSGFIIAANMQFQSLFGENNVFTLIHPRDQRRIRETLEQRNSSLTTVEQCLTVYAGFDGSRLEQLYDWSVGAYRSEYAVLTAK